MFCLFWKQCRINIRMANCGKFTGNPVASQFAKYLEYVSKLLYTYIFICLLSMSANIYIYILQEGRSAYLRVQAKRQRTSSSSLDALHIIALESLAFQN